MAKRKTKNNPAETNGDSAFVIEPEKNAVIVRVPVKFYRRNGRQMVLAQDDASGTNQQAVPATNNALAINLAKAWLWQEQLESSEFSSIDELGRANGVDRTCVSRILRLTSICPSLVELILIDSEPSGLSLRALRKGVPEACPEQLRDR
ncbi:MAG: hypothetical protein ABL888_01300 [Pirellulaceae bacterium]